MIASNILKGILRHGLTLIGGALVMFGVLSQGQNVEITGYIVSLISVIQSATTSNKQTFSDQLQGVIRHILTFVGGLGFLKGWYGGGQFIEIGGTIAAAAGLIWSAIVNRNKEIPPVAK